MVTLTAKEVSISSTATGRAKTAKGHGASERIKWLLAYAKTACTIHSERRQLRKLSDDQLQDIGITRQQVNAEINRGFFDIPER